MGSKECVHPTCTSDFCRRIKKPKTRFILKRPIRKTSKKRVKLLIEQKVQIEKDRQLFLEIWQEREHIDFETGDLIYGEPLTIYFHHCLPRRRSRFKQFRHCKWNILLVSLITHTNADAGMKFTPKIQAYYDYLISHMDEIKKDTYVPSFKKFENENS